MKRFLKAATYIGMLAVLICLAMPAFGQGTDLGSVNGLVTDTTGAVIPNATVQITDALTGAVRQTKTNASGNYAMFGLKSGHYTVTVFAQGMGVKQVTGVVLQGSDSVSVNVKLSVGMAQQQVTVTDAAPMIDTDNPTISQTISHKAIIELPRDTRDAYSFLYLNPNVTQSDANGDFKFIGSQSYGASYSLDGQRSNGGIDGGHTASEPPLEAVGSINLLTNNFSAEYAGVANIRITTKRGGDHYHGSLFYNNRNSALAAWSVQDKIGQESFSPTAFQSKYPTPYFNTNDFGGAIGGPVPELSKTWFFAAYERDMDVSPTDVQSSTLAHPSLWVGDFSGVDDSAKPAVPSNIQLSASEIAQDTVGGLGQQFIRVPQRLLNPDVQKLIGLYFPHIGTGVPMDSSDGRIAGGFQTNMKGFSTRDMGTLRIDHDFSEADHFYAVYNVSALTSAENPVVSPYVGLGLTQENQMNNTLSLSYTHMFGSTLVNEVRGGFNTQNELTHSNTKLGGFLSSIGFSNQDVTAYGGIVGPDELSTFGHMAISFSNKFATFTNGGRNTYRPTDVGLMTFGDTLTWTIGKHDLRFGGDIIRNSLTDGFASNRGNPRGMITYTGTGTSPFADFILGEAPTTASYINQPRPPMEAYNWEQGYFVQDTWKVTPKVTVDMGLRYQLETPFIEDNDLLANFDPNHPSPTTGLPGRFVIPSDRTLKYLDTRIISFGYVLADKSGLGVGRGLVRTDKTDFAPRLGIAWQLTNKSVLRGGYGMFYPTSAAQGIRDPIGTNPFNQGLTKRDVAGNPLQGWPGGPDGGIPMAGGAVTSGFGNTPAVNAVPFGLKEPLIQQYNVTFEQQLGDNTAIRVSYLGSRMTRLIGGRDLNELAPNDIPFGTTTGDGVTACDPYAGNCNYSPEDLARMRFPQLGDFVLSYGNYGKGYSNAFQTQLERQYHNGLLFSLAYTLLDQRSDALDTGNSSLGGIAYNPFQPEDDYSRDGFVSRHRVVGYAVYDLPFGRGKKFASNLPRVADLFLGGWQTTTDAFVQSGTGFTPFWVCDNCDPASPGNIGVGSIDAVGDFGNEPSYRPVLLTSNYKLKGHGAIWNAAAFGLPSVGSDLFSNPAVVKRNALTGPGDWAASLGVHKAFRLNDRFTASVGADIDNVFNHPMFAPDSDYGGGGGPFAQLGDFNISVNPQTLKVNPITDVTPNDLFGKLQNSFSQQGIDSRRSIRLRARITF